MYNNEAVKFDVDLLDRWREDLDFLIVFVRSSLGFLCDFSILNVYYQSSLLSGVVTAFIVQFYEKAFEPDYRRVSAMLTAQMLNDGRTSAGLPLIDLPDSLNIAGINQEFVRYKPYVTATILLWISLEISLATTVIAVSVKQWLNNYACNISADPRTMALVRHQRFLGLKNWNVGPIVHTLPILAVISILLLLVAGIIFAATFSGVMCGIVSFIGAIFGGFFIISLIIPAYIPRCPYVTSLTMVYCWFIHSLTSKRRASVRWKPKFPVFIFPQHLTRLGIIFREYERNSVEKNTEVLTAQALSWLHQISTANTSVDEVIMESLIGTGGTLELPVRTATPSPSRSFERRVDPPANSKTIHIHKEMVDSCNIHLDTMEKLEAYVRTHNPPLECLHIGGPPLHDLHGRRLFNACQLFSKVNSQVLDRMGSLWMKTTNSYSFPSPSNLQPARPAPSIHPPRTYSTQVNPFGEGSSFAV